MNSVVNDMCSLFRSRAQSEVLGEMQERRTFENEVDNRLYGIEVSLESITKNLEEVMNTLKKLSKR